jgi:hypothetical protein
MSGAAPKHVAVSRANAFLPRSFTCDALLQQVARYLGASV